MSVLSVLVSAALGVGALSVDAWAATAQTTSMDPSDEEVLQEFGLEVDDVDGELVARLDELERGPSLTRDEIMTPIEDLEEFDDSELAEAMALKLLLATDALAALDLFDDSEDPFLDSMLRDLHRAIPTDDAEPEDHLLLLARFGQEFPELLTALDERGVDVGEPLWLIDDLVMLGVFDDPVNADAISPFDFLFGISDLALRDGELPETDEDTFFDDLAVMALAARIEPVEIEVPVTSTTTAPPATTSSSAPEQLASVDDEAESALPVALVAGGGVLAMALAAGGFLATRRRSEGANLAEAAPSPSPSPGPVAGAKVDGAPMSLLLEVNRRLTASLDPGLVATTAVTEASRLLDADAGLLVRRSGGHLVAVDAQPPAPFAIDRLDRSSLRRVVETGRSISGVADDEAVLVRVPMSMAAAAIVSDGTIIGALLLVRDPGRPFDRKDLETLEVLTELAGSALAAADTHGEATEIEPLTGLKNRRRLDRDLGALAEQLYPNEQRQATAYLMIDVDHFKTFNDTNGHAAGDDALRAVAKVLRDNVRPNDLVYRYGGEEFAVLLPNTTATEAVEVAERLRAAVEAAPVPGALQQPLGRLTVSIGASDTVDGGVEDLVQRADAALYGAKDRGRNQVCVHRPG